MVDTTMVAPPASDPVIAPQQAAPTAGPTIAQLQSAFMQAHAAGDVQNATVLAAAIRQMAATQAPGAPGGAPGLPAPAGATLPSTAPPAPVGGALAQPAPVGNADNGGVGTGIARGAFGTITGAARLVNHLGNAAGLISTEKMNREDASANQSEAQYQADRKAAGRDGFDAAELAGGVVDPTNLIGLGVVSKAATAFKLAMRAMGVGALQGGLQGAGHADADNTVGGAAGGAAIGGAIGGVAAPVAGAVAKGVGAGVNAALQTTVGKAITDAVGNAAHFFTAGKVGATVEQKTAATLDAVAQELRAKGIDPHDLAPAMRQSVEDAVMAAFKEGKTVSPVAIVNQADAATIPGFKLTQGQANRGVTQWSREINVSHMPESGGQPLVDRFGQQNQLLKNDLNRIGGETVGTEKYQGGNAIQSKLQARDAGKAQAVRDAYDAAKSSLGKYSELDGTQAADVYGKTMKGYGKENIPSAVRGAFEEIGMGGGKQTRSFDVETAEDMIKTINKHLGSANPQQNAALRELHKGLTDSIDSLADEGVNKAGKESAALYKSARGLASERFAEQESAPAIKAALDSSTNADTFVQKFIINGQTNHLKALAQAAPEVMADVRGQVVNHLKQVAAGNDLQGQKTLTPEAFNSALKNMGTEKLTAIFGAEDAAQLRRIGRLAAARLERPEGESVNWSKSGNRAANFIISALDHLPGGRALGGVLKTGLETSQNADFAKNALQATAAPKRAALTTSKENMLRSIGGAAGTNVNQTTR